MKEAKEQTKQVKTVRSALYFLLKNGYNIKYTR